jgi:hypothetical protein
MVGRFHIGVVGLAAIVLGCSSPLIQPAIDGGRGGQGGRRIDARPDLGVDVVADAGADLAADVAPDGDRDASGDAAACDCRVDGFTLTMSWACFCTKFGCSDREPACASNRTAYPGCGLTADNFNTFAGPSISVWDDSGALVGRQYASDTSYYQCPSDPTLQAGRVRGGRFPDATCGEVACICSGGTTTCGTPDAGTDARDGGGADAGCGGPAMGCAVGSPGGQCSDVGQLAPCINGQWTCPPSTIPFSQCKCVGAPPPGCTCGSLGWSCPTDAGGH